MSAPDGFGLKIGALMLGQRLKNRVAGADLAEKICEIAGRKNLTVMFVGAKAGVAKMAADKMRERWPNLKITGDNGLSKIWMSDNKLFYDPQENEILLKKINKTAPAILCVAFGAPAQELWIGENIAKIPSVKIAIGVGGTLDFIAGRLPRAPKFLRALGLEWLFRLIIQPKERAPRIFKAVVKFPLRCLLWRCRMFYKYQEQSFAVILNETGKIFIARDKKTGTWLLPDARNNAVALFENAAINEKQLLKIRHEKNVAINRYPKIIQIFTGLNGTRHSLSIMKFLGAGQNLQLPEGSGWDDYKWVSREMLDNELPRRFSTLAEQIRKTL
jgi:N-acetylglucosaminyldiphosphoundecaprenol N-acetyl-beta-D-mannosaminyltransferase